MKTKTQKKYVYEGFGFPVELSSVQLIQIGGEWLPQIDVRKLADEVIKAIPLQEERLSAYQVKFIRDNFSISLRDFATNVVHVSHIMSFVRYSASSFGPNDPGTLNNN